MGRISREQTSHLLLFIYQMEFHILYQNQHYVFPIINGADPILLMLFLNSIVKNSINLVVTTKSNEKTLLDESPINSVLMKELNRYLKQPELKSILRKPVYTGYCPVMIHDGKGNWSSDDSFKRRPDIDACLNYCKREGYDAKHCPCNQIFGEK